MANERQMVVFEADEQAKITKMIKELQPDSTLIAFKDLSTIMKKAIGMLPTKVIPILQQLCDSYSITRTVIEAGFNNSSGILSEFVIKSWEVTQHGMTKNDQKALITLGNRLNTDIIDNLETFVESSRSELVEIHSQLLLEATGGKVQNLLDKRKELESDFLQLSEQLINKASECGVNQGIIDLLRLTALLTKIGSAIGNNQAMLDALQAAKSFSAGLIIDWETAKKLSAGFPADWATAKNQVKSGAPKLKRQVRDWKNQVQGHCDNLSEKRKSLSLLSRKLPDVQIGDMVTNAQKNLSKLMKRTDLSEETDDVSESDTNEKIIDMLQQAKESFAKVAGDWEVIKDEMKAVIGKLKEQIHVYKTKVQECRDHQSKEQGSFSIFSWKVRDVFVGNGERIIQENVNRLIERTNFLDGIFQNGSIIDLVKGLLDGKAALPLYEAKQIQLEQEHKELKERYDQASKEFYTVVGEIDEICRSTGTANVESMKMVDELCCAVQSGQESIVSTYTLMRIHVSAIYVDPDLLMDSVLDALQVLNIIDGYIGTRKIEDVKRVLALE
ncbi:unnamed protein product [Rotaria sp. Silwood2]|nr:unnamed protein product [Rotaria sp. Silwood2]CAF4651975.1 unnamed protein product [Rotaria sp. Silwood2]